MPLQLQPQSRVTLCPVNGRDSWRARRCEENWWSSTSRMLNIFPFSASCRSCIIIPRCDIFSYLIRCIVSRIDPFGNMRVSMLPLPVMRCSHLTIVAILSLGTTSLAITLLISISSSPAAAVASAPATTVPGSTFISSSVGSPPVATV